MVKLSRSSTVFGRRLREARTEVGIPQDKLGVMIGLDEGSSSARISRYETGEHEPPYSIAVSLAQVLKVPVAYLYCDDDDLAELLLLLGRVDAAGWSAVKAMLSEGQASSCNT